MSCGDDNLKQKQRIQLKQELTWWNIAIVYQTMLPKNQLFCTEKSRILTGSRLCCYSWNFRFRKRLFADLLQSSSLQNSQKNTCATVLIWIELQPLWLELYWKRQTSVQVVFCDFSKIFETTYFVEHFRVTAYSYCVLNK